MDIIISAALLLIVAATIFLRVSRDKWREARGPGFFRSRYRSDGITVQLQAAIDAPASSPTAKPKRCIFLS